MPEDHLIFYREDWGDWERPSREMLNRGFYYHDSLFETLRIRHGRPLFVEEHLTRMENGIQFLGLDIGQKGLRHFFSEEVMPLLDDFEGLEGRLRMQAFRMGEGGYAPFGNAAGWLVEVVRLDRDPYLVHDSLRLCNYLEVPLFASPLSAIKGAQAQTYVLAAKFASEMNFDDAILYGNDAVAEISNANIFLVREDKLVTPDPGSGCLPGICRGVILDLAAGEGLEVEETQVSWEDLRDADEVFVTNVIRGVRAVGEVEGMLFPVGEGTVGWRLQRALERATRAF
ncbi:MAG: aminotransferase class IV [Bacteroidia bacterium]|nr:aminotransferase class IV [Bacteroidia bacterium]